jgi:hypothetical protein
VLPLAHITDVEQGTSYSEDVGRPLCSDSRTVGE